MHGIHATAFMQSLGRTLQPLCKGRWSGVFTIQAQPQLGTLHQQNDLFDLLQLLRCLEVPNPYITKNNQIKTDMTSKNEKSIGITLSVMGGALYLRVVHVRAFSTVLMHSLGWTMQPRCECKWSGVLMIPARPQQELHINSSCDVCFSACQFCHCRKDKACTTQDFP